jgi:hypothetical protein
LGASATHSSDAVDDADVVLTSIPFARAAELTFILAKAPDRAVVIDTSNYYSHRDAIVPSVEAGKVESVGVRAVRPTCREGVAQHPRRIARHEASSRRTLEADGLADRR